MNAQARYWDEFVQRKRDAIYIGKYHARTESIDRWISILSAVAASGAIATWAIWKTYDFIWAAIVAASQVLAAAKPFLPYRARLKALSGLSVELESIALVAETDWFKVSQGMLSEAEIHNLTMKLKERAHLAATKAFGGASLPENAKLLERAEAAATGYMSGLASDEDAT